MQKYKVSITLSVLFFVSVLQGLIVTCDQIKEVEKYVDKDTLVIFDLDNTIMETTNYKGSDQWFSAAVEYFIKQYKLSSLEAVAKVVPHYIKTHSVAQVNPVEKDTVPLIAALQKREICIIGMTARSEGCIFDTIRQLSSIEVDLSKTSIGPKLINDFELPHRATYKHGILFCSNNHKGDALIALLAREEMYNKEFRYPKKIVCIDDKEKNVKSIEEEAKKLGIAFVGLRYAYLDEKVTTFELTKAMIAMIDPKGNSSHVEAVSTESI